MIILPCPFCGKQPKFTRFKESPPEIEDPYWGLGCGVRNRCLVNPIAWGDTKKEAVKIWNQRDHELTPGILFAIDEMMRFGAEDAARHLLRVVSLGYGGAEKADRIFFAKAIEEESLYNDTVALIQEHFELHQSA